MTIALNNPAPARVAGFNLDLEDCAKLLLRVSLGVLLLLHGVAKISNGIDPILGAVAQAGLPAALAYGVYVGEVVAPLLLIVGVWTRASAIVIAINMVVAVLLVHMKDLGSLSQSGGWALELQAFYLVSALAVALLGPGRLAAGSERGS
ncbi:MAG: DoxX family protein [Pseudomonadota bacterium]